MRRLLPLLLLIGCERAADGACAPTFQDPEGRLGEGGVAALVAAWEAWRDAVGPGRVCVNDVLVLDLDEGESATSGWPAYGILVDPDADDLPRALREGACAQLEAQAGLLADHPGVFDTSKFREQRYTFECAEGPVTWDLLPEIGGACAADPAWDRAEDFEDAAFLREVVYPRAPYLRPEPFTLTAGAALHLEDPEGDVYQLAGVGDALLVVRCVRDEAGEVCTAERVDPSDGGADVLFEVAGADVRVARPYLGDGVAVVHTLADGAPAAWRVTETSVEPVFPPEGYPERGAVVGDVLYTTNQLSETLATVNLVTGATSELAFPEHPDDVVVNGLLGTADGPVLAYIEAVVDIEGHGVTIGVGAYVLAQLRADGWAELARGLSADLVGAADGRLVGAFAPDGRTMFPGRVVGAWDLAAGELLASDDVCPTASPSVVTAGVAWWAERDDAGVVLTPYALGE